MVKRTAKHYNGSLPTSKQLADLLPEALSAIREKAGEPTEEIFSFWPQLIGEKMAPLTEPVSYIEGVLTVKVKSSTLYSLLSVHERPRLLKQLREKFSVRNLVFRVG
jgi:hypothetical protein